MYYATIFVAMLKERSILKLFEDDTLKYKQSSADFEQIGCLC